MNNERAKTLLGDEFFQTLVDKQKKLYIDNILNSSEEDIDVRERSIIKLRAIDEFVASIESISRDKDVDKKRLKIF
jgi:hypothetical protein